MIDKEKVLTGLECCIYGYGCDSCESCPYYGKYAGHCVSKGLMPDVLELLKNEPLPVLNVGKCGIYFGDCPHCGKRVTKKNTSYCPYCGKAVKWDG